MEGDMVGALDGLELGSIVGSKLKDGSTEAIKDGWLDGSAEGVKEGALDGLTLSEGSVDGAADGYRLVVGRSDVVGPMLSDGSVDVDGTALVDGALDGFCVNSGISIGEGIGGKGILIGEGVGGRGSAVVGLEVVVLVEPSISS